MNIAWTFWNLLAAAYGEGTYSESVYSHQGVLDGGLVDTGTAIIAFVSVACFLIFVGLVIRLWKRPGKNKTPDQQ